MAEKRPMIVIKKITVGGGGHHGGAWKVAFADFMTAMMAFFLCMWLLSQNEETKKALSDHFSTPSVIEYQFRNFGVQLTLEKLFNDLLNEPFDTVAKLLQPMDKTPNVFEFGSDKIALAFLADVLGEDAKNIEINQNEISFVIPDYKLFNPGTADPNSDFLIVMDKVKQITTGLFNAQVTLTSQFFLDGVNNSDPVLAERVALARLELVKNKVEASLEHENTKVFGTTDVRERKLAQSNARLTGFIRFDIDTKGGAKEEKGSRSGANSTLFEQTSKGKDLYEELNEDFRRQVREGRESNGIGE